MNLLIPKNTTELLQTLQAIQGNNNPQKPQADYRYVIYVRKSTDDKEKQVRSLPDQIDECKTFAKEKGLRWVDIIAESESAKESNKREKFEKMILELKSGKYDGIIAWHPDRLARNMKDAGEIIDLIDKGIIKDMKFVSFMFENTPSGKMLLGITFVLSKQYSDHLSESVDRGNRHSIEDGEHIGKSKHGYFKDEAQRLRPDGNNFVLLKNAFAMRVAGKPFPEISQYLLDNGYSRINKVKSKKRYFTMSMQKLQRMMTDSVYTGVLVHGKNMVDLTKLYDFQPMLSVDDFVKINKLTNDSRYVRLWRNYKKGNIQSDLLRGMVMCAECDRFMSTGITSKPNGMKYFYYRCDTKVCTRKSKSVRAKVIRDYVSDFLKKKPFSSNKAYKHYVEEMDRVSAERIQSAKATVISLKTQKQKLEEKLINTKDLLLGDSDAETKEHFKGDLKKFSQEIAEMQENIEKAQAYVTNSKLTTLTYSDFLKLMENMPKIIGSAKKIRDLDFIIKKIFSNFTVRGNKVEKSTLNSPFNGLIDEKISNGAG